MIIVHIVDLIYFQDKTGSVSSLNQLDDSFETVDKLKQRLEEVEMEKNTLIKQVSEVLISEASVALYNSCSHSKPGPEVIKPFSCSAQLRLKCILLINVKMPTIVGILIFISRINYRLWSSKPANLIYFAILVFMNSVNFMLS